MKRIITVSVLAALALCGCQVVEISEAIPSPSSEAVVFTAVMENDAEVATKTCLDNYGNVLWKQGDKVSIFYGSTINEQFQVTDDSDGSTSATLLPVSDAATTGELWFVAGTELEHNVAYYPYSSTVTVEKADEDVTEYKISGITIPQTQHYAEASFENGAFPMAAVTSSTADRNLKFKNVLGGIKLMIKGTATITSITLTSNTNNRSSAIWGTATVRVSNETAPVITMNREFDRNAVTLDCGDGVQLNADVAIPFIIALPPKTMSDGFTVVITDSNNRHMEIATSRAQTINRSRLLTMPEITYEVTVDYVDLGLTSGLKWATCNLGASAPEDFGDYYGWGEVTTKTEYNWNNYQWSDDGTLYTLTKYNTNPDNGLDGFVDGKTLLSDYNYVDDVARQVYGGSWRIPTPAEWQELLDECTWTWTTQNGINGELVTGPNNNSIFLPAAGYELASIHPQNNAGHYWTSSIDDGPEGYTFDAWALRFRTISGALTVDINRMGRAYGNTIRPVSN